VNVVAACDFRSVGRVDNHHGVADNRVGTGGAVRAPDGCALKIRYRSWVALVLWTPFGALLAVGGTAGATGGDPSAAIFAAIGVFVVAFTWWPVLVLSSDGLAVRNLRTRRMAWADVARVDVGSQLSHLGRFWRHVHLVARGSSPRLAAQAYPGLLVHTRSAGTIAVCAIRQSVLDKSESGRAYRVVAELTAARRAAHRGDDPVAAVRALRRGHL
jgi:hypothetical protein